MNHVTMKQHYLKQCNIIYPYSRNLSFEMLGNVVSVHAIKACNGSTGAAPLVLNLCARWREQSILYQPTAPGKGPRYPFNIRFNTDKKDNICLKQLLVENLQFNSFPGEYSSNGLIKFKFYFPYKGSKGTSKLCKEGCKNTNTGIMRCQHTIEVKIMGYGALGTCGNAISKDPVLILSFILFLSIQQITLSTDSLEASTT